MEAKNKVSVNRSKASHETRKLPTFCLLLLNPNKRFYWQGTSSIA